MTVSLSSIRCSLQVALLRNVTQNLRALNAVLNQRSLDLYFYFQNTPSENDVEISEVSATEVMSYFIDLPVYAFQEVLPLSNRIPELGIRIFHRCEDGKTDA